MSNIFNELKKRKVFRTTGIYLATAFIILQAASILVPTLLMPEWTMRLITLFVIGLVIGLIIFNKDK